MNKYLIIWKPRESDSSAVTIEVREMNPLAAVHKLRPNLPAGARIVHISCNGSTEHLSEGQLGNY